MNASQTVSTVPKPNLLLARCHAAIAEAVEKGKSEAILYIKPDQQPELFRLLRNMGYRPERLLEAMPRGNTRITW